MDMKTISWLGDIYEKFEEDTVNFVESKVQNVGSSVKNFYLEVMKDRKPESYVDPVKVALNNSSLLAQNEIKANLKEQPRDIDVKLKGKDKLGGICESQSLGIREDSDERNNRMSSVCENRECYSTASDTSVAFASGETIKKICNDLSDIYSPELGASIEVAASNMTLSAESVRHNQEDSECTSSLARGCASNETAMETRDRLPVISMPVISCSTHFAASDMTSSVESSGLLTEDFALISTYACLSSESSAWTHIHDDRVYHTGLETSTDTIGKESAERSENCNSDVVKTFDVIEQNVEIVELIDKQQLEETSVLVEGSKLCSPQQPVRHKSYKKKIQEAFSSRKRSTREYEHLRTQHEVEPLNREAEQNAVRTLVAKSNMQLSACDFPDSEWELIEIDETSVNSISFGNQC